MSCVNNTDVNLLFLVRIIVHCVNEACSEKGLCIAAVEEQRSSSLHPCGALAVEYYNAFVQSIFLTNWCKDKNA